MTPLSEFSIFLLLLIFAGRVRRAMFADSSSWTIRHHRCVGSLSKYRISATAVAGGHNRWGGTCAHRELELLDRLEKMRKLRERDGCRSLRSAFASI
jgi:hypothetical protein